jgi:hypothetical protein
MAQAMTRYPGEVDCYHFGPMAGLGTRHGAQLGDGAKAAGRLAGGFRRFYCYFTADERTGGHRRWAAMPGVASPDGGGE